MGPAVIQRTSRSCGRPDRHNMNRNPPFPCLGLCIVMTIESDPATTTKTPNTRSWVPGAILLFVASITRIASLALFCHAYGLNFCDEGWSDRVDGQAAVNPLAMTGAVIGMIVSTVLYWVGFLRLTRIGHHEVS